MNNVNLAVASNAIIVGFNVRPAEKVGEMAEREGVDIRQYSVIYQAIEEIEAALKGMLKPEYEEVAARHRRGPRGVPVQQVRQHRRLPRPVAARSAATPRPGWCATASSSRESLAIESLRRFKDDVTEVRDGYECGIGLGSFNDIQVGDVDRDLRDAGEAARLTRPHAARSPTAVRSPTGPAWPPRPAARHDDMYLGTLSLDLLLGDVHSLKEKRSVVRPIVAELRRRFDVSAAETGHLDLHRRAEVGRRRRRPPTPGTAARSSTPASGSSPPVRRSSCSPRGSRIWDDEDE